MVRGQNVIKKWSALAYAYASAVRELFDEGDRARACFPFSNGLRTLTAAAVKAISALCLYKNRPKIKCARESKERRREIVKEIDKWAILSELLSIRSQQLAINSAFDNGSDGLLEADSMAARILRETTSYITSLRCQSCIGDVTAPPSPFPALPLSWPSEKME